MYHMVMPNHVHGIIVIDKQDDGRNDINKCNDGNDVRNVQTQYFASLQPSTSTQK